MFTKGQRIIITSKCGIHGQKGTVCYTEPHPNGRIKVYCKWDMDDPSADPTWMADNDMKLLSNFVFGDTVQVGKKTLVVDGIIKFNEKRAILISRKRLI